MPRSQQTDIIPAHVIRPLKSFAVLGSNRDFKQRQRGRRRERHKVRENPKVPLRMTGGKQVNFLRSAHSRSQRPRSFWLATGIATSGQVQLRKSAIHGLPVILRMLRSKSDKSDWFWSQSIVFAQPFKTGMSLGGQGSRYFQRMTKGTAGTRLRSAPT